MNSTDATNPGADAGTSQRHTYTFENRSNSYFMGNDVVVTRDDGASLTLNAKDGMVAISVKNHDQWIMPSDGEEIHALATDLNNANRSRMAGDPYGREDWTDVIYEQVREDWWEGATELAQEMGFDRVYSAGRSGGWCCIAGTNADEYAQIIMHPEDDDEREQRDDILELLFSLQAGIPDSVAYFYDRIREEHSELEREREACLIRGED